MTEIDYKEQRNAWAMLALIFLFFFLAQAILQFVWVFPQLMNQVCHAYGYGPMVSFTFENYGYNLASLKCQGTITPVKVI